MVLDNIKLQTTWNDAAGSINSNFVKIQMAIASLEGGSGGLNEEELLAFLVGNGYITTNDLSNYYTKHEVNELIDDIKAGDIDLANYYTKGEIDAKGYLTSDSLVGYAKTTEVAETYATKIALSAVDGRLVSLESYFATSEDAGTQIDKWNEIVAFLNATEGTTLAGILATYYTKTEIDGKITTINNSITSVDNKYASTKTWADTLASLIVNENGSVRIKANLIVDGDTASGGEGGSSSVGIQGILLNGTTYRDENGDGIIDLGTIGGGTLTEITYQMIVEALGYTPVSSASLGSLAYANGVTWAQVSGLLAGGDEFNIVPSGHNGVFSFNHRAKDGGSATITEYRMRNGGGSYAPVRASSFIAHGGTSSQFLKADGSLDSTGYLPLTGTTNILSYTNNTILVLRNNGTGSESGIRYDVGGSIKAWIGYSGGSYGVNLYSYASGKSLGIKDDGTPYYDSHTLYHSGNFNPANYLPLSGGTISGTTTGPLVVNTTNATEVGIPLAINSSKKVWFGYSTSVGGAYMYNAVAKRYMGILDDGSAFLGGNTILHSGNIGDYATRLDGSNARTTKLTSSKSLDNYKYGFYSYINGNNPTNSFGDNTALFAFTSNRGNDTWQIAFDGNGITNTAGPRFGIRGNFAGQGWTSWYLIATTDSNVASATKLATARTIWGQSFDGTGNITGSLQLNNNVAIYLKNTSGSFKDALKISSSDNFMIGYGVSEAGHNTYLEGNNVFLRYGQSHATGLILNSSGNVGIGTSSPSSKLSVDSNAASSLPSLGALATNYTIEFGYAGKYGTYLGTLGSGIGFIQQGRSDGAATAYNLLLQPLGGNVGIGTASPAYKLDVNGNVRLGVGADESVLLYLNSERPWGFVQVGTGAAAHLSLRAFSNSKYFFIQSPDGNPIAGFLADRDTPIMTIHAPLTISSTASITGAVSMASTLSVGGNTTINGGAYLKGGVDVYGSTPYIDFHFGNDTADYTSRIIEDAKGRLYLNRVLHLLNGERAGIGGINSSYKFNVEGDTMLNGAVAVTSTLNVSGVTTLGSNIFIPNNNAYCSKKTDGTRVDMMYVSKNNVLGIGIGNLPIEMNGNATIKGNLVVQGDISA